jgi:hypothetical protein
MASRLGGAGGHSIQPISCIFPDSPESDESSFIDIVERWCGVTSVRIETRHAATSLEDLAAAIGPIASAHSLPQTAPRMRANGGARVLLSGELGDLVMAKNSQHAAGLVEHLVEHGRPQRFLADAWRWSERMRKPIWRVLPSLLTPLLTAAREENLRHHRQMRTLAKSHGTSRRDTATAFALAPDFVNRTRPAPKSFTKEISRFPRAKRAMARGIYWWTTSSNLATPDNEPYVRMTFPFAHRPLVEYVLAVPETVLWEPGYPRALMRRAFAGFVPGTILDRRYKGYASPALTRLLRPLVAELARDTVHCQLVERGYVEVNGFRRQLEGLLDGSLANAAHVAALLTVESWLRQQDRSMPRKDIGEARTFAASTARAS